VAFSSDNSRIASVLENGKVQIWECESGDVVRVESDDRFGMPVVAWSPDRRTLAVVRDYNIELWDSYSGEAMRRANAGHAISVLAWSPNGESLALAGGAVIRLWGSDLMPRGRFRLGLQQANERTTAVAWSPQADRLFTAGENGMIQVWNAKTLAPERTLPGHSGLVTQVAASADGRVLASKSMDGSIRFCDLTEWQNIGMDRESAAEGPFPTLAFHPTLPILASADPERSAVTIRHFRRKDAVEARPVQVFISYSRNDIEFRRARWFRNWEMWSGEGGSSAGATKRSCRDKRGVRRFSRSSNPRKSLCC